MSDEYRCSHITEYYGAGGSQWDTEFELYRRGMKYVMSTDMSVTITTSRSMFKIGDMIKVKMTGTIVTLGG